MEAHQHPYCRVEAPESGLLGHIQCIFCLDANVSDRALKLAGRSQDWRAPLGRNLGFGRHRKAEWRAEAIEGVYRSGRRVGFVGCMGLAHQRDFFSPCQGRALLFREQVRDFRPHRQERNLVHRHCFAKVAAVEIDAVRAAIDLGHPQTDELNELFR